jgi:hypothetical protein
MSEHSKNSDKEPFMKFDAILHYEMDELESTAYKICLLWMEKSKKIFPDYNHMRMKNGDPRKSLIFKICYKLARETQGILEEKDYELYIRAQLDILKYIKASDKSNLFLDANCLVGEKAWKRWKLWKKKYDDLAKKPTEISEISLPGVIKAIDGIERTKEFIVKTFGAEPSIELYRQAYINNNLFRWSNFGKISPYYLAISPYIAQIMQPEDLKRLNFDPEVYKSCITDKVIQRFKELFPYEELSL